MALKCRMDAPDWVREPHRAATAAPAPVASDPAAGSLRGKAQRSVEAMMWRRRLERERRRFRQGCELRAAMRGPVLVVSAAELCAAQRWACRPVRSARARGAGRPRGMASRSCARSGDSGSSGDGSGSGGSEPSAALAGSWAGRGMPVRPSTGRAGL